MQVRCGSVTNNQAFQNLQDLHKNQHAMNTYTLRV